ncbi:MAG TPA: energy transducer TonB [Gemmatimonadales bacterium]
MHITLLESDRSFLRSAELITLSIALHATLLGVAAVSPAGSFRLPTDEREARVMFLLPPDAAGKADRQAELFLPGKPGSGLDEASHLPAEGQGLRLVGNVTRSRARGERSGAKGSEPFGPAPFLAQKVYTALEVDRMVERYESSAAPVYPPQLEVRRTQGQVVAAYVVDTAGRVDTTTIRVLGSDHPLFTESVRTALAEARFRPAKRGGHAVRQLVQQRFRFKLEQ